MFITYKVEMEERYLSDSGYSADLNNVSIYLVSFTLGNPFAQNLSTPPRCPYWTAVGVDRICWIRVLRFVQDGNSIRVDTLTCVEAQSLAALYCIWMIVVDNKFSNEGK